VTHDALDRLKIRDQLEETIAIYRIATGHELAELEAAEGASQ